MVLQHVLLSLPEEGTSEERKEVGKAKGGSWMGLLASPGASGNTNTPQKHFIFCSTLPFGRDQNIPSVWSEEHMKCRAYVHHHCSSRCQPQTSTHACPGDASRQHCLNGPFFCTCKFRHHWQSVNTMASKPSPLSASGHPCVTIRCPVPLGSTRTRLFPMRKGELAGAK